ncbi:MAG: molybdopterin-binding protein [Betaproteobacteria bacterium]|jgi:molybdopterin-biosynthesis enzyme MoeA-like protein
MQENLLSSPSFGLVIVGDEIMSGKRADKHMSKVIELLASRGLQLDYAHYVGDDPKKITQTLQRAFESGDIVFSCGGIGATPDDHTRQCAAKALDLELVLHPEAESLIRQRIMDQAKEAGQVYEPDHPNHVHRLNMGMFPLGAAIIPNPYNKIPGFQCKSANPQLLKSHPWASVYFLPGFPVMAWPMIEWVLEAYCKPWFRKAAWSEKSVIVYGAMEAALTPIMIKLEAQFQGLKVFSLPSVDHPEHGRHIELGVKGHPDVATPAYEELLKDLHDFGASMGPQLVR